MIRVWSDVGFVTVIDLVSDEILTVIRVSDLIMRS